MKRNPIGYPLRPVLARLIVNAAEQNPRLFGFFAAYTLSAGLYPLVGVALPRLVLGELLRPEGARLQALLTAVGALFLLSAGLGFAKTYLERHTAIQITYLRLRYMEDLLRKLLRMRYQYVEDADFYNRHERAMDATASNPTGVEGVYHLLFESPALLLTVLLLGGLIAARSPLMLLALLLHVGVGMRVGNAVNAYRHGLHAEIGRANRRRQYFLDTTHDFGFGKDIRIYGLRDRVLDHYRREIDAYVSLMGRIAGREFRLGFWGLATLLLSDATVYGILIRDTLRGLSVAQFSMYLAAVAVLSALLRTLVENGVKLLNEGRYVHDFFEFLQMDLGEKGGSLCAAPEGPLEVVFDHVSFRYPGSDRDVLRDLNLTIQKGERLAIVGVNGAGKTTLVKLLCGLFEVTEGEIRINGRPVGEYDKQTLFDMFSVVFQDVNVLAYSLLENVACCAVPDRERTRRALERAGLGPRLETLAKGLDQPLGKVIEAEGIELSGGEAQKLSIARALYKDANMVIMDEPTAALDALAEAEIYERFAELVSGKTAIFISHRLASTKFCDRIAFFDAEGMKEYGSHEELMHLRGAYHHMFTVQGKYYHQTADGGAA